MTNQLTVDEILSNGFKIGFKNILSVWVIFILWILTFWIPYINVGTTIAIASLPIVLNDKYMLSPIEIFASKYRKYLGGFLIILAINCLVFVFSALFLFIPFLVLMHSWCIAICLMVDKDLNPIEALVESNKRTYGHKWTIFFSFLILVLPVLIIELLFVMIPESKFFFGIILFIYGLFLPPILFGAQTYIYQTLIVQKF